METRIDHPLRASDAAPNREKLALSFRNEIHSSKAVSMLADLDANQLAQLMHRRLHIGAHLIRALPTLTAERLRPQAIVSGITQRVSALGGGQRMQIATPGGEVQEDLAGPPRSCRCCRPFPSQCAAPLPIPTRTCGRQQSLQVWLWIGAEIRRLRRHHALHGEVDLLCLEQFANLSS